MHAKAQPPLSDGVNPTEDAIDDAIASAAAEEAAASIPLALAEAMDKGVVGAGSTVIFAAFGAGLTWAGAVAKL